MHRIGGVRLGRTPLHNEKPKPLELAANRQSKHPFHPTCKPVRSVYQPVFLPTVAPPIGCAVFGAVSPVLKGGYSPTIALPSICSFRTLWPRYGRPRAAGEVVRTDSRLR